MEKISLYIWDLTRDDGSIERRSMRRGFGPRWTDTRIELQDWKQECTTLVGELVERCRREIRANGNSVVTLARLKYAIRSDTILRSPPPFPGPLIEFSLAAFAVVVKEPATGFIVRKLVNFDTLHQPYIVHCVYSIYGEEFHRFLLQSLHVNPREA